jgi:integrase
MARRFGQNGYIERKGNAYYVRFRIDVPGREKRAYRSVRICPVSGPGKMTKPERQRRATEIIALSGADTEAHFEAVETITLGCTFRSQAKRFIEDAMRRKRKPVKPATVSTWDYALEKWLLPQLGDLPLAKVENDTVKLLVTKMHDSGLSPKSIENYVGLVKLVVKSAKEKGRELFPRKWSNEEMDIPEVRSQRRPYFTAEMVSAIISNSAARERALYALLAGSGLRIGEALGLEVGKHLSPDCRTLDVQQSIWHSALQAPKTENAVRRIHLCGELANLLKTFIGDRKEGFLFRNTSGKPLSQRNVLGRSLHPILEKKLKVEKQGFHGFRRFRLTWLRKNRVPGDLERFWMGHSDQEIGDLYSKMEEEAEFCQAVAESVGLGFKLGDGKTAATGDVAPIAPKTHVEISRG